jgi:hypothetical protein
MINFILSPYNWIKALNNLREGNYLSSYNYLKKIPNSITRKPKFYKYYLFLGFTSIFLNKHIEAKESVLIAIDRIDNQNIGINEDEKLYLKCYSLILLKQIKLELRQNTSDLDDNINNLQIQYNKTNVKDILLNYFPIKDF